MDICQQQSDPMLADTALIIRTATGCVIYSIFMKGYPDIVWLVPRAIARSAQFKPMADWIPDYALKEILLTALEAAAVR